MSRIYCDTRALHDRVAIAKLSRFLILPHFLRRAGIHFVGKCSNVLLPAFVKESESSRIEAWLLDPAVQPVFSDLVVLEFSATLSRLVRERKAKAEEAREVVGLFTSWREARGRPLTITRQMFALARIIVEDAPLGVRGPDALHLALLQVTGLPFATFDARLRRAADTIGLATLEPPPL